MPTIEDPASRLEDMIDQADSSLQKEVAFLLSRLQDAFSEDEILEMLDSRNFAALQAEIDRTALVMATSVTSLTYVAGGVGTAEWLAENIDVLMSFDQANFRAAEYIRTNQVALATGFSVGQQETVSSIIARGTREGINPIEQARQIKTGLGLTEFQENAVNNYRQFLLTGDSQALSRDLRDKRFDSTVRRVVAGEIGLSESQVDTMVERYRQRYIKYRSEVIARTEALGGIHAGAEGMYQQAIDAGDLDADNITGKWNTSGLDNRRDTHVTMQGQLRPFGEPFISGGGALLMHPGDQRAPVSETIQCVCAVSRTITL